MLSDSPRSFNPIQRRKTDVQQNEIWAQFPSLFDCSKPIRCFTHNLQPRLVLQGGLGETTPRLVIIYYEYSKELSFHMCPRHVQNPILGGKLLNEGSSVSQRTVTVRV